MHPVPLIYYEMNIDLKNTRSLAALKGRIVEAAGTAKEGSWLVGLNFEEASMDAPRLPDRHDLDAACPDRPVIIIKHDGHSVMANSRAIEAAGISASTPDPAHGIIERERGGRPSGVFREAAARLVLSAIPMPDMESMMQGARASFIKLASRGITSIGAVLQTGEEGPAGSAGVFDISLMELFLEHLCVNVYSILIADDREKVTAALSSKLNGGENGRLAVGGIKIFADGTFGSCTAHMEAPFSDHPDTTGFPAHEPDEIYRRMVMAHTAGLQLDIHAIGDAANRTCIDLFKRLLREYPGRDRRHRLQHASLLDAGMIGDIAKLGLVISTQPQFIHSEKGWLHRRLGEKRSKWVYPFRSLLDAGIKVAGASDAPVESTDVLHSIQLCVTREGFETRQCVTAAEAVRMFTLDAAYAQFEETIKGSIRPGKRADMVILSQNPVNVPPDEISSIRVEGTIIGGKRISGKGISGLSQNTQLSEEMS
jgi:hypothetical protein